jgi:flagellar hook assembly protein FlgD
LLQNYPNPFNPETWIPYQLADDAHVSLSIYDQRGHIVRTLDIGRQKSGVYRDKAKAAYWDGRNQNGELVTSGTYYYQLRADDYTAFRRMVIVK